MNNYYDILGINKNASDSDIKSAFKSLSKKWHPDRFVNKSEKEQKEAENKFKEINEAYQTLSDPTKRAQYDNPMGGFSGFGFDPFGSFFRHGASKMPKRGSDCFIDIHIKLEDLYNESTRTVEYDRKIRCHKCNGTKGESHTCPICNGTGVKTEVTQSGNTIYQRQIQCPNCDGTGKIIDKKCDNCNGTGFENKKSTFVIELNKIHLGLDKMYSLGNHGNESPDIDGPIGDLYATIYFDYDHEKYAFSNNSLYEQISIPYYDALLGVNLKHKLPSGEEITIHIPANSTNKNIIKVVGKGPFKNNYFACINIYYPDIIDADKDALMQIKNNHEGN